MCATGPQAGGLMSGGVRELLCCVEEEDWSTGERYSNQWSMRLPQIQQDRETVREVDSSHHQCFSQEWEASCRRSLPTDGGCHPGMAELRSGGVDRQPRRITLPLGGTAAGARRIILPLGGAAAGARRITLPLGGAAAGHPNASLHWHPGDTRDASAVGAKATGFKETYGAALEAYRG